MPGCFIRKKKNNLQLPLVGILPEQRLQAAVQMRFLSVHIGFIF